MPSLRPDTYLEFPAPSFGYAIRDAGAELVISRLQEGGHPLHYAVDATFAARHVGKDRQQARGLLGAILDMGRKPQNDASYLGKILQNDDVVRHYSDPRIALVGAAGMERYARNTLAQLVVNWLPEEGAPEILSELDRAVKSAFERPSLVATFSDSSVRDPADALFAAVLAHLAPHGNGILVEVVKHLRIQNGADAETADLLTRLTRGQRARDVVRGANVSAPGAPAP